MAAGATGGVADAVARLRARGAWAVALCIADLHSPYRRLPRLLAEARAARAAAGDTPFVTLVNGDVFERGNVVALRSRAAPDWRFLSALRALGPLVVNLGNHETAIEDEPLEVIGRLRGVGARVVGGLIDRRSGAPLAPPAAALALGGRRLAVLGLSLAEPEVYRPEARAVLGFSDPLELARRMTPAVRESDALVVMSHAGVALDKLALDGLPRGALLFGGHDHLRFGWRGRGRTLVHVGAYGAALGLAGFAGARTVLWEDVDVPLDGPVDEGLAGAIAAAEAAHLTAHDRETVAVSPRALTTEEGIMLSVRAVRRACNADVGMVGHTSFGDGLPEGPVPRWRFDAFMRFEDTLHVAELPGETLAPLLAHANQHRARALSRRTGDFLHASPAEIAPGGVYRVAANGWAVARQRIYFGREGLPFEQAPGQCLKRVTRSAFAG